MDKLEEVLKKVGVWDKNKHDISDPSLPEANRAYRTAKRMDDYAKAVGYYRKAPEPERKERTSDDRYTGYVKKSSIKKTDNKPYDYDEVIKRKVEERRKDTWSF